MMKSNQLWGITLLILILFAVPIISSSEFGVEITKKETSTVNVNTFVGNLSNLSQMGDTNLDGTQSDNDILSWDDLTQLWISSPASAVGNTIWAILNPALINNSGSLDINRSWINFTTSLVANRTSSTDTNISERFDNLTSVDCIAGQLVIGIQENGTVLCATDSGGADTNLSEWRGNLTDSTCAGSVVVGIHANGSVICEADDVGTGITNNTAGWTLNVTQLYANAFHTLANNFLWTVTDDGSNLIMDASSVGGTNSFFIETAGTFLEIVANPGPSNDYEMFAFEETQGADTDINFYESGAGRNEIWTGGSVRFGDTKSSACSNTTSAVDCGVNADADLVIADDIWAGGILTTNESLVSNSVNISKICIGTNCIDDWADVNGSATDTNWYADQNVNQSANVTFGSITLETNGTLNITFNDYNTFGDDGGVKLYGVRGDSKPSIEFYSYDPNLDKVKGVGWFTCHYNLTNGNRHQHCSIETLDNSTGTASINTKFEIHYGSNLTSADEDLYAQFSTLNQVRFGSGVDIFMRDGDIKSASNIDFFPHNQGSLALRITNNTGGSVLTLQALGTGNVEMLDNFNVSTGKDICITGGNCLSSSITDTNWTRTQLDAWNLSYGNWTRTQLDAWNLSYGNWTRTQLNAFNISFNWYANQNVNDSANVTFYNVTAIGSVTANTLVSLDNSDGGILWHFDTDRDWQLENRGTGAGSNLWLSQANSNKRFYIGRQSGNDNYTVKIQAQNTDGTDPVMVLRPISKVDGNKALHIIQNYNGSAIRIDSKSLNYSGIDIQMQNGDNSIALNTNGRINTTSNISAKYYFGDGSALTGISGTDTNWTRTQLNIDFNDTQWWNKTYADTLYSTGSHTVNTNLTLNYTQGSISQGNFTISETWFTSLWNRIFATWTPNLAWTNQSNVFTTDQNITGRLNVSDKISANNISTKFLYVRNNFTINNSVFFDNGSHIIWD